MTDPATAQQLVRPDPAASAPQPDPARGQARSSRRTQSGATRRTSRADPASRTRPGLPQTAYRRHRRYGQAGYPPATATAGYAAYPAAPPDQRPGHRLDDRLDRSGFAYLRSPARRRDHGPRRPTQIRERGEEGDGIALAGIIVGWIVTALVGARHRSSTS